MLIRKLSILIVLLAAAIIILGYNFQKPSYLSFSDGAKFADIARNVFNGLGYGSSFKFSGRLLQQQLSTFPYPATWTPPIMIFSIASSFRIFGVTDAAVISASVLFYFLLITAVYLFGKKLFGNLTGVLASLAVASNLNILDYATSGASESPFIFEIVASAYFLALKKKWTTVLGFLFMVLMYFTRPQAFIYIAGLLLFYLLIKFKSNKAIVFFLVVLGLGLLIDRTLLTLFQGKYFLYSITTRGINAATQYLPGNASSDILRGAEQVASFQEIYKKVFYNLYNFYKLLPQIASPYMWALFIVGLFVWTKDKEVNSFKIASIFMIALTFLVGAISIPLYRYLHPAIPFVYLFAVATLIWTVKLIVDGQGLMFKKIKNEYLVAGISSALIFLFVIGQTLGVIFLDSRFKSGVVNKNKPPVYVQLSLILKENTGFEDVVVTNLDTWGSWYGQRRTVWYPLKPEQLQGLENEIDAIYLTNYLIDDENYYMGAEWRQLYNKPEKIEDQYIAKNFKFIGEFKVSSNETYERQEGHAILLVRK
jgi:4-amino-4-deoxy-L-arabinose transferase-like glycosyltransferase